MTKELGTGGERPGQPATPERISLDLAERGGGRQRAWVSVAAALVVAAAFGGVTGLIAGQEAGLAVAGAIALGLVLLTWSQTRRTVSLTGTVVRVSTFGSRSVDLRHAERLDLVVMDVRGVRTISLLVANTMRARAINLPLATYSGTGGRELGILVLRKLADALAASGNSGGLVFSELLVAQLRAEARGEVPPDRPLYRLASSAPEGRRLAMKLKQDAVTRFVASLD